MDWRGMSGYGIKIAALVFCIIFSYTTFMPQCLAETHKLAEIRALGEKGDKEAQYYLGYAFFHGENTDQDFKKAAYWFERAAEQGDTNAQIVLGHMYYNGQGVSKDYQKAFYWLEKGAENGTSEEQIALAEMYFDGDESELEASRAIHWYTKAAEQGNYRAKSYLAWLYSRTDGVIPQDKSKAKYWYEEAGKENASAAYTTGQWLYWNDDRKRAAYWIQEAAKQGNEEAQFKLAEMYYLGDSLLQDYNEAIYWYKKAAEHGHLEAQFIVGEMCRLGQGLKSNTKQAAYWYKKSADKNHAVARFWLGQMQGEKLGQVVGGRWKPKTVQQALLDAQFATAEMYKNEHWGDEHWAEYWYKKAAEQGHLEAQYAFGVWFSDENSDHVDKEQAAYWLEKAAIQGNLKAMHSLGDLFYYRGLIDVGEISIIAVPFDNRCHLDSCFHKEIDEHVLRIFPYLYKRGQNATDDLTKATYWFEKAVSQGSSEDIFKLGVISHLLGNDMQTYKWLSLAAAHDDKQAAQILVLLDKR